MTKIKAFLGKHKKLCIFAAVLAALYLAYSLFLKPSAQPANAGAQAPVQTMTLTRQDIRSTLSASGSITSDTVCEVNTTLSYPIAELRVTEGDYVQAGDILAILDTESLDADIAAQQRSQSSAAQRAQLAVDQAARRLQDARNKKTIDEDRWDDMDDDAYDDMLRQDSLAIEDAQDALNNAVLEQQSLMSDELQRLYQTKIDCTITAPKSGVITQLAQVGASGAGGPIAIIEDPGVPLLEVNIKEYDINSLCLGQPVAITTGAQDSFTGQVTWIAPKAVKNESGEYMFPIHISFDSVDDTLHLGMSAKAQITLQTREGVFVVPLDALGTDEQGNAVVYAKQPDGSFAPLVVETGLENDFEVEISGAGLTEGLEIQSLAPEMGMGA